MRKIITVLIFLFIITGFLQAIEILSDENAELDINIRAGIVSEFNFNDLVHGFDFYDTRLGINGIFRQKLGFSFSFDPSEIDNNGVTYEFLKDLYLSFYFKNSFSLNGGHMIIPIGEEILISPADRAYIYHSKGSELMFPDYKIGVLFKIRELGGIFNIDTGIFNTADINAMEVFSRNLGLNFRCFLENDRGKRLYFKTGYGCFIDTEVNIYQSFFLLFNIDTAGSQEFSFFSEFDTNLFFTFSMDMSVFTSASYRISFTEPFITFEWFDKTVTEDRTDDSICINSGINFHVFEDKFFIRPLYKFDRRLEDNYSDHSVLVMLLLVL